MNGVRKNRYIWCLKNIIDYNNSKLLNIKVFVVIVILF